MSRFWPRRGGDFEVLAPQGRKFRGYSSAWGGIPSLTRPGPVELLGICIRPCPVLRGLSDPTEVPRGNHPPPPSPCIVHETKIQFQKVKMLLALQVFASFSLDFQNPNSKSQSGVPAKRGSLPSAEPSVGPGRVSDCNAHKPAAPDTF